MITATVLLSLPWSCSSTTRPLEVNTALLEQVETAEWSCWPGRKDAEVLELGAGALGATDVEVRLRAAGLLGRKRPAGAGGALLARLDLEESPLVRLEIISALGKLPGDLAASALRRIAGSALDGQERVLALANLGGRAEDQAILARALSAADADERLAAARALIRYPSEAQAERVGAALDSEKMEPVRWVLAEALRLCSSGEWSGRFCSLLGDDNFLVSMAASRAVAARAGVRPCLDEVVELAGDSEQPWLARLGAAEVVGAWLGRAEEDVKAPGEEADGRLEELVIERVDAVLNDRIRQPALRRSWLRCLPLCRGERARELERRLRGQAGKPLEVAGHRGGAAELLGAGARILDAIPATLPAYSEPPFRRYSSFRLARLRPPRLRLLGGTGDKIYLEFFLSSAPNNVSAILHLVDRGAFTGLRPRRLTEPLGLLIDPVVKDADPAAGCALAAELSSRRILRGTIISHPLHGGGGRLFIAGRPLPEWEGRVTVLGRVLLGQRALGGLDVDTELDLVKP